MSILQICEWIGNTSVSVGIRESTWTYPIIESVHVLGLTLFLGLLLLWDTRLLGLVLRKVSVSALWRQLFPWIAAGAVLVTISGTLLFWSDPVRFYGNVFFRVKVLALVLAAANAVAYHLGIERCGELPRREARGVGVGDPVVRRRHHGTRDRVLLTSGFSGRPVL